MSKAMQALKDFLTSSPSVVYPDDVLELLQPVEHENANLKRKLEILKDHGIEIVDAVAGGFEIYNKEHARADQLKGENDKLRKLVLEIWRSCPVSEDDCAKCPHYIEESEEVSCDVPILMEKLGVVMDS